MALDAYRQALKAEAQQAKQPESEKKRGLGSILQDKESEDSALFRLSLEQNGQTKRAERFFAGAMEEGDMDELKTQFEAFEKKKASVKEVLQQVTPKRIDELIGEKGILASAKELGGGSEAIAGIYQDYLIRLAFDDPKAYEEIEKSFAALKAYRGGEYKQLDEVVTEQYKALGITEQRLAEIMRISDEKERVNALQREAREALGWFGRWFGGSEDWKGKVRDLGGRKGEMDRASQELEGYQKALGTTLGFLVDKNPEIRKAFNQELLGIRKPPEKSMNFAEAKNAVERLLRRENYEKEREKFRKEYKDNGKVYNLAKPESDPTNVDIDREFARQYQDKIKTALGGGGSFWLSVFEAMFKMINPIPRKRASKVSAQTT